MNNFANDKDTRKVMLGGEVFLVPILAAKQNKIIDPLILRLLPIFAKWNDDREGALAQLGGEQYDDLLEIAFVAITRAQPEITREKFLDLPITLPELIAAFSLIAGQTGVFQRSNEEAVLGEA